MKRVSRGGAWVLVLAAVTVVGVRLYHQSPGSRRSVGRPAASRSAGVEAFRDGQAGSACPEGCVAPLPGCKIKGNVSFRTGERIYHLPGQRWYDETVINPRYGERWFCTEEEAEANGWRRARV